ncbi:unnamed protein product [Moneuplotes crassus]|uniref:Niemann-Pick C1 N-terminal domain-containing protein n=1 Tax=Euplotes crassus TaxID=5936 RepID=A0AAD2CXE8_EUPCR|nr:unnamed protein product [Moneuplotes crassus]
MNQGRRSSYTSLIFISVLLLCYFGQGFGDDRVPRCGFRGGCVRDGSQQGQPCPDPSNTEVPHREISSPKMLTTSAQYIKQICPYLVGQETCCDDDQVLLMYNNFKTIDSLFGDCSLCSTNIKRFWCEYTCSVYQDYFVDSFEQERVEEVDFPVLIQKVRVESSVVCDLYNSCKKNPFVTSLASGQSAVGFLEFMGSNAVQTGKVKISFDFTNDPEDTLFMDMYPCDLDVDGILDGYKVKQCTCNYCEAACTPVKGSAFPGFFDGFSIIIIVIVYVSLVILSIIIFFVKKKWLSSDDEEETFSEDGNDSQRDNLLNGSKDSNTFLFGSDQNNTISHGASIGKINKSSIDKSVDRSVNVGN